MNKETLRQMSFSPARLVNCPLSTPPVAVSTSYREKTHWVWGGSVVKGEDDRFHMFVSVWSKQVPFNPYWLTNSRVVRAVSEALEGPYRYAEEVLPPRREMFWDGRMTHNPTIHRCEDYYLLFYTGTTYPGPAPGAEWQPTWSHETMVSAHVNQRIGLAYSKSVHGPWTRPDRPLLEPRKEHWDALLLTNPAPCIFDNGQVVMIYKSLRERGGPMHLGLAEAEHWSKTFKRALNEPVLDYGGAGKGVEDGYLWWDGDKFLLLTKDVSGSLTAEKGAICLLTSNNAIDWNPDEAREIISKTDLNRDNPYAYAFTALERPQVLIDEKPDPSYVFFAAAEGGEDGFAGADDSYNVCLQFGRSLVQ